jgi:hypothetical protein
MSIGSALFDDVRQRWASQIGPRQLQALEAHLNQVVERRPLGAEDLARDADAHASGRG